MSTATTSGNFRHLTRKMVQGVFYVLAATNLVTTGMIISEDLQKTHAHSPTYTTVGKLVSAETLQKTPLLWTGSVAAMGIGVVVADTLKLYGRTLANPVFPRKP